KARDVGTTGINFGIAIGHPFGDGAGDARTFFDPNRGGRPQPFDFGRFAEKGKAVGREGEETVDGVTDANLFVAENVGHELEGLFELHIEIFFGEGELGGRERGLFDGGNVVGFPKNRAVGVRANFEVAAVLPFVHVGVHIADDGEFDFARRVRELGNGPDANHLVNGGRERNVCASHARDARTPDAARDDDGIRVNVAFIGADAANVSVLYVESSDFGVGEDGERAAALSVFAHEGACAEGIYCTNSFGVESAEDDFFVDEGDALFDFVGGNEFHAFDAPRFT